MARIGVRNRASKFFSSLISGSQGKGGRPRGGRPTLNNSNPTVGTICRRRFVVADSLDAER